MSRALCLSAVCAFVLSSSLAIGGPLAGHSNAYFDGATTWTGSAPFDADPMDPNALKGYVDWAVFAVGDFPYAGYAPTAGEFVYAYQLFVTGTPPVTSYTVPLDNPADNIGAFADLLGAIPNNMTLVAPGYAKWDFGGIAQGASSEGMAFSSSQLPADGYSITVNHGQTAYQFPHAVPGPSPIPEPATLLLALMGLPLISRRRSA